MVLIKDNELFEIGGKSVGLLQKFNNSLIFDQRLLFVETSISFVYADALFNAGILNRLETERIKNGLQTILKRAEHDTNYFDNSPFEDIYAFIEEKLVQLIGEPARKILTGRSRAEQMSTALRFWLRGEIVEISVLAKNFQQSLIQTGEKQFQAVLPTSKDAEKNQLRSWANWCLAYFEMIARDRERLDEIWRRVNILPLFADENAEIMLEIDFEETARALKFEGIAANNLDSVSDRDFVIEFVGSCSILIMHLASFAVDLIFYSADESQVIQFTDEKEADSNLPLNKICTTALKNLSGKAARVFGHQTSIFSNLKGLSSKTGKDSQEVLESVFDTVDTIKLCLENARIILDLIVIDDSKTDIAAETNSVVNDFFSEKIYEALENAKNNLNFEEK